MKWSKVITSVVPGPFLLWASQWLDLIARTNLTHPKWQVEAQNTALLIGAVAAVLIGTVFIGARRSFLKAATLIGFLLMLVFFGACWWIWVQLGKGMPPQDAIWWQDWWRLLSIAFMVLLVATISFAALLIKNESRYIVWIVFGLFLLIVVVIAISRWWRCPVDA